MPARSSRRSDLAFFGVPVAAVVCCAGGPALIAVVGGLGAGVTGGIVAGVLALTVSSAAAFGWRRWRGRRLEASEERMRVEVLYFDGCPSHERLLPTLRRLAARVDATVTVRRVETTEEADASRFLGSPSVRVNGVDIEPGADARTDYGLKCRLYRTPDGLSGEPAEHWLSNALAGGMPPSEAATQKAGPDDVAFFASTEVAQRHLAQPELEGAILTVPEATLAGRKRFGDLLDRLAELEVR